MLISTDSLIKITIIFFKTTLLAVLTIHNYYFNQVQSLFRIQQMQEQEL